jgi:hypothetical protein
VPHESQPNPTQADRQDLLAASRRVDWRFLWPDPLLRRVALVGEERPRLRAALELLSERVVGADESPDLVVVCGATPDDLRRAAERVPPGGRLYAELRGPRVAHARALALLSGLGFGGLAAHWHHPDFERCEEIVPLASPEVVRHALGRRGSRLRARVGRLALETGLLGRVIPCVSIVGQRRGDSGVEPRNAALSLLLSRPAPEVSPAARSLLLTPRFAASRHVVFLLFEPDDDRPSLVAKMPRLPGDVGGIEREAAALRALDRLRENGFQGAPHLVAFEAATPRALLAETALTGTPMTPAVVRRAPERCLAAVAALLEEIGLADPAVATADSHWYERLLEEPLGRFAASFDGGEEHLLVERTLELVAPLRGAALPLVLEHGDAGHPNLFLLESGRAALIDWEVCEPRGLPGHDLFFFLAYLAFAVAGAGMTDERRAVFHETFFGARAPYAQAVAGYAERVGVPPRLLRPLFVASWARYAAGLPGRLRTTGGERGVPSTESLRGHRYYVLWRHTVENAGDLHLPGEGRG